MAERLAVLNQFQEKLGSLHFLDPAAGSGNFLTETYISLRSLENRVLAEKIRIQSDSTHSNLTAGQISFGSLDGTTENPIRVTIDQFYGIEINDFAVTVAKTALWIAESQMMKETEDVIHEQLQFLPLLTNAHIIEGNALRLNWSDVIPASKLNYIMGNPPFVGNARLSAEQKADRLRLFEKGGGELDYVACWYKKTADYIGTAQIRCAFVSTNSICQGQQVYPLWKDLMDSGIIINFAYKTFRWDSEAHITAHVYCIIVGFSRDETSKRIIYEKDSAIEASNINGYLMDAPNVFISKRRTPISDVPSVVYGIKPADNGNLILSNEEREALLQAEPQAEKWIRPFITAKEFLHGNTRWCLWLKGIEPSELNAMPLVKERVAACREWRSRQTPSGDAYKLKDKPTLMRSSKKFKEGNFIVLPRHSGERRRYIPFGFVKKGCIPGDSVSILPEADLYHFGVLCSNVHMAWMRAVCGRLEMRYRYTSDIVYNNFVWCMPGDAQKAAIEKSAQAILDVRALFPKSSLDDLYNPDTMPPELFDAHQNNNRAVMRAYGFPVNDMSEGDCVAALMKMYQEVVQ